MSVAVSQAQPTLNGFTPSWTDIKTTFEVDGGETVADVDYSDIKHATKVSVGEQRGPSGGRVMRRTTGSKTLTAAATFYQDGLEKLQSALASSPLAVTRGDEVDVSTVPFDILIMWSMPGDAQIRQVRLLGCRLLGDDATYTEGDEPNKSAVDLNPISIGRWNEAAGKWITL